MEGEKKKRDTEEEDKGKRDGDELKQSTYALTLKQPQVLFTDLRTRLARICCTNICFFLHMTSLYRCMIVQKSLIHMFNGSGCLS